jgi:predicted acylesterase/phospholipase RssA
MSKAITLILGGTGIKGIASIGILQSLQNHGVGIKKIIAAGISAPISAQFALGKDPDLLTEEFALFFKDNNHSLWGLEQFTGLLMSRRRRIVGSFSYFLRERLFCHANFLNDSVLSWETVEPQITRFFGDKTFSDLKIPLVVSAIDLKRGKVVLLDEGKLSDSMKASIAFPGLLPPVSVGNMELPLDSITKKDTPVLTIDLPSPFAGGNPQSLLEIVSIVDDIRSRTIKEKLLIKTDYLFRLEGMKKFRWGDYHQIPEMVTLARNETDKLLKTTTLP